MPMDSAVWSDLAKDQKMNRRTRNKAPGQGGGQAMTSFGGINEFDGSFSAKTSRSTQPMNLMMNSRNTVRMMKIESCSDG